MAPINPLPVSPDPVLHLIAGPDGSGKTTLATRVIVPVTGLRFVNADVIAARRWPEAQAEHGNEASVIAAQERVQLISARTSFVAETVFSHTSKVALIDQARAAGFHVHLHVVVVSEDLAVARVTDRVRRGGHTVPEEKTRQRYQRIWPLIVQARSVAERSFFYDNSKATEPLRSIASYQSGVLVGAPQSPTWTPVVLTI